MDIKALAPYNAWHNQELATPEHGQLALFVTPDINRRMLAGTEHFIVKVTSLTEASRISDVLAYYDLFLYGHGMRKDYTNATELCMFVKDEGWVVWMSSQYNDFSTSEKEELAEEDKFVVNGLWTFPEDAE